MTSDDLPERERAESPAAPKSEPSLPEPSASLAGRDDGPGLSAPVPRQSLHRRVIETEGFLREDGLFDIEARLIDTKGRAYRDTLGRERRAGDRLHDICVRLTLSTDMVVQDIEVAMPTTPFSLCSGVMPNFRCLIGARIGGGWRQTVRERVSNTDGCTHVREMLSVMATVAFQTMASLSLRQIGLKGAAPSQPTGRPHFIDGCHAWDSGLGVVAHLYPQFSRKS
jgi:hypothetical protein